MVPRTDQDTRRHPNRTKVCSPLSGQKSHWIRVRKTTSDPGRVFHPRNVSSRADGIFGQSRNITTDMVIPILRSGEPRTSHSSQLLYFYTWTIDATRLEQHLAQQRVHSFIAAYEGCRVRIGDNSGPSRALTVIYPSVVYPLGVKFRNNWWTPGRDVCQVTARD
jgi:hypothetical protein